MPPIPETDIPEDAHGVVFTKPWVVELILDLVGYVPEADLASRIIVEPSAGDGAFLSLIVQRLALSCQRHGKKIEEATDSLVAFELDPRSAKSAQELVIEVLGGLSVDHDSAAKLAQCWIRAGDFLLESAHLNGRADFVVGNPPYIRLEEMEERAAVYRSAYPTMVGRADIYVAFFEAALYQLKSGASLGFICADRWTRNQYGSALRELITKRFAVDAFIEMHHADAFDSEVSAYPAITVLSNKPQSTAVVAWAEAGVEANGGRAIAAHVQAVMNGTTENQSLPSLSASAVERWFKGSDPWSLMEPAKLKLLRRIEDTFPTLEETGALVGIGVATGADKVFVTKDANIAEPDRMLPLAMAKDARGEEFSWSGHYLVNPWTEEGVADLDQFPKLKAYYEAHAERLTGRLVAKKSKRWFRTIDRVNLWLTNKPKLYFPDFGAKSSPVLDKGETYPHHNVYYIHSDSWDLEVLGGLMMSDIIQLYLSAYCVRMRGGYLRFQAQYLRRVRVPRFEEISEDQRQSFREAFRSRDFGMATTTAIDVFGLTSEEKVALGY